MFNFQPVYQWYRGVIPPYKTPAFYRFLETAGRLAGYVLNSYRFQKQISVRFANINTARSYIPDNQIELPSYCLMPETWQTLQPYVPDIDPRDYAAAATLAITAALLHEAGHFVFSLPRPVEMVDKATHPQAKEFFNENDRALISLIQIVDDLYLEDQLGRRPYGFFLFLYDEIMFSPQAFDYCISEHLREPNGQSIINVLVSYKNQTLRDALAWDEIPNEAITLLDSALGASDHSERANIACSLYELFRDLFQQDKQNGNNSYPQQNGSIWDQSPKDQSMFGHMEGDSDKIDNAFANAKHETNEHEESLGKIVKYLREPLPDPNQFDDDIPPVVEQDVMMITRYHDTIEPAKEFESFGRLLSNLRCKNYPPGPPLDRGKKINNQRLSRFATDGKIFTIPYQRDVKKEAEVIISINASGSMSDIFPEVLSAAYGVEESLKDSRVHCTVYAHTTTENTTPLLVRIASTDDINMAERFARATAIRMAYSYDGAIIRHLGDQFSPRDNQKVLIELNDGEPNCGGYTGREAVRHTKQAVEALREKGIIVLSLSLESGVIRPNNGIYGEKYNVDASHDVESALQYALQGALV